MTAEVSGNANNFFGKMMVIPDYVGLSSFHEKTRRCELDSCAREIQRIIKFEGGQ